MNSKSSKKRRLDRSEDREDAVASSPSIGGSKIRDEITSSSSSVCSSLSSLFSLDNIEKNKQVRQQLEMCKQEDIEEANLASTLAYRVEYNSRSRKCIGDAASTLDKYGLAILQRRKKQDSNDDSNSSEQYHHGQSRVLAYHANYRPILQKDLLNEMLRRSKMIEKKICTRLSELNIETTITRRYKQRVLNDLETPRNFKFREISSRCLGRLDVRYGMDEAPFNDPSLTTSAPWLPLVHELLGSDAELKYMGLIYSFAGSVDQPYHGDGPHLFGNLFQCPMHAVNVFIPLSDISEDLGPTEFVAGSHKLDVAKEVNELLKNNGAFAKGANGNKRLARISPILKAGSVLLYDYRTIHRGTANISTSNETRHMFYMLYTKPWFSENINFGDVSVFSEEARSLLESSESQNLIAKNEDSNSCGYCDIETM